MTRAHAAAALALLGSVTAPRPAAAEEPPPQEILRAPYFELESAIVRTTYFEQHGHGYQSRAGPPGGPGIESLFVLEPEIEVVVAQGDRFTHRFYVPIDLVTAASPNAIDVTSSASARNEATAFDWTGTYRLDHGTLSARTAAHGEENYHAWLAGLEAALAFADDNALAAVSFHESLDWFDAYALDGHHTGYGSRHASNVNASLSQLLSPTTVAVASYGFTVQKGMLSNGWNTVPTPNWGVALERVPGVRDRHAATLRLAQLPWKGALKASYRLYADDWGILAHSGEVELDQRLASFAWIGTTYRLHHQSAVDFFTTSAPRSTRLATADSDLDDFYAHTLGLKASFDVPVRVPVGSKLHVDASLERYLRTNDLQASVVSIAVGFLP